jgi:hypothetical protein
MRTPETSKEYLSELVAGLERIETEHTGITYERWPKKDRERYERLRKRYDEVIAVLFRDKDRPAND